MIAAFKQLDDIHVNNLYRESGYALGTNMFISAISKTMKPEMFVGLVEYLTKNQDSMTESWAKSLESGGAPIAPAREGALQAVANLNTLVDVLNLKDAARKSLENLAKSPTSKG